MPGKSFLRPVFIAAAIIIFMPLVLSAGEYGTVVKRDGTKYENVNKIADKNFNIITLRRGDKDTDAGLIDFDVVYDSVENDVITPIFVSADKPEKEASGSGTELRVSGDKTWDAGISLLGAFSLPYGDYYEGIDGNVGFEGHFVLSIDRKMAFRAIIARSGMSAEEPFQLSAMKFILGIQINTYEPQMEPGNAICYGVVGLGLIKYKVPLNYDLYIYSLMEGTHIHELDSESDLLFHGSGGAIIIVSPNFGFDISASLDLVAGTRSGSEGYGMGYIFDFRGGLTILF